MNCHLFEAEHAKEQKSFSLNKPKWDLCAQFLSWLGFQLKGNPWFPFFCFETANFRTVQTIKGWIVVYLLIWAEHAKEQKSFSLTKPRWHLYAPVLSWLGFQLKGKPWFLFSCFETAISKLSKQLRVKLSSIYLFGLQRLLYPH